MRPRAPWYRRKLGRLAGVVVALVAAAAAIGFLAPSTAAWRVAQVALVALAAALYLVAILRSAD